ncbi:MAG: peptide chain release factor N(5)-glutamine methyltransferase [Anaerolineaceae bacterium]
MKTTESTSLSAWQKAAATALAGLTDTPQLEARLLLALVLKRPQTWLITHSDTLLTGNQIVHLDDLITARIQGNPLPYLLGSWPFFDRDFFVSPGVLIPRPETELLVEEALVWLRKHPGLRRAADVGTGSGCIAISLAAEIPDLLLTALEISPDALEVAKKNISRYLFQDRIELLSSDLFNAVAGCYDLICANLPYIPGSTLEELPVASHEPRLALDGGPDGLRIIQRLLMQIPARLSPGGLALLEIEAGQGQTVLDLSAQVLPGFSAKVLPDLAGRPRLLRIDSPQD